MSLIESTPFSNGVQSFVAPIFLGSPSPTGGDTATQGAGGLPVGERDDAWAISEGVYFPPALTARWTPLDTVGHGLVNSVISHRIPSAVLKQYAESYFLFFHPTDPSQDIEVVNVYHDIVSLTPVSNHVALNRVEIYENCIEVKSALPKAPSSVATSSRQIHLRYLLSQPQALLLFLIRYAAVNDVLWEHQAIMAFRYWCYLLTSPRLLSRFLTFYVAWVDALLAGLLPLKRGRIDRFSSRSRSRLIKKINKATNIRDGGFFVTLTYPENYSLDFTEWKRHLDNYLKRLRRFAKKYGGELRYVWKLEFQKRGAPHFHLMIFGLPQTAFNDLLISTTQGWFEIVNSGDQKHLAAGTNVRWMKNTAMVAAYVGKYLSKLDANQKVNDETGEITLLSTGRFWGFSRNFEFPCTVLYLSDESLVKFRRMMRRWLEKKQAARYARRLGHLRRFFVVGVGDSTPFVYRGFAHLQCL